jgi:hypothetical protein
MASMKTGILATRSAWAGRRGLAACLLVGLLSGAALGSPAQELPDCGTALNAEDLGPSALPRAGAGLAPLARRDGPWPVRTAIHIVRTSAGQGGLSLYQLDLALNRANADFGAAGIVFTVVDAVDYIDSDAFYYDIDTTQEINALRSTNPVPQALNLYFTENMPFCGMSSFSWQAVQGIVMVNSCTVTSWNPTSFSHELGHYFDLLHTHETAHGSECVDGSNCATAGDGLCDTPADPGLLSCGPGANEYCVDTNCAYIGEALDPCGGLPYAPATDNMMSNSRPLCRDTFTPDQIQLMTATLLDIRADHILDLSGVGAPGGESVDATLPLLTPPSPNPSAAGIRYGIALSEPQRVSLRVVDIAGRRVADLIEGRLPAGTHDFAWEPRRELSSGVYFLVLEAGARRETQRLVLLR